MSINRRQLLFLLGSVTTAAAFGAFPNVSLADTEVEEVFKVIPLPYKYNALEPYIDAATMEFHHDRHYVAYTKNLNIAIGEFPDLKTKSAEDLLKDLESLPEKARTAIRNNGGGYVNHTMFWEIMKPNGGGNPVGELAKQIDRTFGSFVEFQAEFNKQGLQRFGSGWVWLVSNRDELEIMTTANQDSPLSEGKYPIMGNDVWEHAYYLNYRNKRDEYLKNWWNVVNWEEVEKRYQTAMGNGQWAIGDRSKD
jgi:superoxide dismutase, Fe-Mn family